MLADISDFIKRNYVKYGDANGSWLENESFESSVILKSFANPKGI